MTKKKFAELELSLLHLQQNVEIPETHLIIHPVIQRAVEQVSSLPRRSAITDTGLSGSIVWCTAKRLAHPSEVPQR